MKQSNSIVLLAAVILVEIVVISASLLLLNAGKDSGLKALGEFSELMSGASTDELKSLDGTSITGVELKSVVMQYMGRVVIMISTKDHPGGFYDVSTISDSNSVYFVPDNLKATCKVYYRSEVAIGVAITQVGVEEAPFDDDYAVGLQSVNALDEEVIGLQYELWCCQRKVDLLVSKLAQKRFIGNSLNEEGLRASINSLTENIYQKSIEIKQLERELEQLYVGTEGGG